MAVNKRIAGITIEIDGDTKKLGNALKGVEKNSRDISSELRQVERLLKLDPKNTQLLAQKQKLLGDAVNNSKERLEALKDAQKQAEQAFKDGKIGEDQYRAIQREVVKAEQELKGLEKQLGEVNNKWKDSTQNVKEFGDKTTAAGKAMMPISAAAGAAVGGIVALTVKSGRAADELNTLSKQTGISTEDLQKFQYAAELIDVPLETFTGSLSRLTRSQRDARDGNEKMQEAFDSLGVSITDSNGDLRDNEEVFYDLIDALGTVANETERDALSMQLFGKSAQDLNPLVLGGADALKELGKEAEDAGLILSQDTLDGLNEFNDEMDKTKAQLEASGAVLGATFGEILLPIIQNLAEWLQKVAEWFRGLDPNIAKVILVVLGLVAAIGPLLMLIGSMATGLSAIMGLFGGTTVAAGGATAATGGFAAAMSAAILPILAVVAAVAAVIAIGVLLYKNWDKVKEFLNNTWEAIKNIFGSAVDWIDSKTNGGFSMMINAVISYLTMLWDNVKVVWDFIKNSFKNALDFIKALLKGDFEGMKNAVRAQMDNISNTIRNLWGNVMKFFRSINLFEIGKNIIQGLIRGIKNMAGAIGNAVKGVVNGAVNGVKNFLGIRSPSKVFAELGEYTGQGFAQGIEATKKAVESASQTIGTAAQIGIGDSRVMHEHGGVLTIKGVNNQNELVAVYDMVMDKLRREVR